MTDCPVCGGAGRVVASVSASDLVLLYRRELHLDVTAELAAAAEFRLVRCGTCDLRHFTPAAAGSDAFYVGLQQFPWYYLADKPEYDVARGYVQPGDRVLEIGCGRGAFGALLGARAHYRGLELSATAVHQATAAGLDVRVETVEAHALEQAGRYDVVSSFQVLEHVPAPLPFLEAAVACLRPGGLLVVSVPYVDGFMGAVSDNVLNLPPHHLTWWSLAALRHVGRQLGLSEVAVTVDELAPDHHVVYLRHRLLTAVGMRRDPARLVYNERRHRTAIAAAGWLGARLEPAFRRRRTMPAGHSVTVVYRRPSAAVEDLGPAG